MQLLSDLFENEFWFRKRLRCGQNTRRLHVIAIANFGKFLGRSPTTNDLSDDTLTAWIACRLDQDKVSPYTANQNAEKIIAQWRFYARRKIVDHWPDVEYAREPLIVPLAWTTTELVALFAAIEKLEGGIAGVPARLWWHGLHATVYDTAERIGAVMDLEWSDLSSNGWLTVRAETRKGRREPRQFQLHADTMTCLRSFPNRSERIFPWTLDPSMLWIRYGKILQAAGLPADRRSKFHRIRRTTASYFKAAGGDAQQLLGHKDAKTTAAYLDMRIVGQVHPCDLIPRPHFGS